jgi:cysteine desulfurase
LIYLDYNATTPCDPSVVEAMLPYFLEKFGNPASRTHSKGWQADEAVKIAAKQIAELINCDANEIVYTSGATESCNLAIKGVFERMKGFGNHIITCTTEHKAVLDTCAHLESMGASVTYLEVDENGQIDLEAYKAAFRADTVLAAFMYANNETGVIHPINQLASIAREQKAYFFCDATQAIGKVKVDVQADNIDLLALSAHKFYGPKGTGILYINKKKPRVQLVAQIDGGGHQDGRRSGTLNVPSIVGMGKAAQICCSAQHWESVNRIEKWRDELAHYFVSHCAPAIVNAQASLRLPNVLNISFLGIKAEQLVSRLNNELAFSVGICLHIGPAESVARAYSYAARCGSN